MKKRKFMRGISVLLAGCMAISMAACQKGDGVQQSNNNEEAKKYVFRGEELDLGLDGYDNFDINEMLYKNEKIYMLVNAFIYGEDFSRKRLLISMNTDGSEKTVTEIQEPQNDSDIKYPDTEEPITDTEEEATPEEEEPAEDEAVDSEIEDGISVMPLARDTIAIDTEPDNSDLTGQIIENRYYENFTIGGENTLLCIESISKQDFTNPDAPTYEEIKEFICLDLQGNELWRVSLQPYFEGEDYYYVNYILTDSKDNIYLLSDTRCLVFDKEGNEISKSKLESKGFMTAYVDSEDKLKVVTWADDKYEDISLGILDPATGNIEEKGKCANGIGGSIYPGYDYDFVMAGSDGLYGYRAGDTEKTQIMSFTNSDLNTTNMNQVLFIAEDVFIASYWDNSTDKYVLVKFTAVPPEEIPDKQVVILGCLYMNYNIRNDVVNFNKSSDEYRIVIRDYSTYGSGDWETARTQLNNDIISGKIPDIIVVNQEMPIQSYISKGILADIYEFIDKDEELNREDYLQNILDAYSVKGKLYQLVPSFGIETYTAKKKWVGDRETWSIQEMQEILAKMPEGATALGEYYSRESMMYAMMNYVGSQFVDWKNGKCNFDSQEFKDLLSYIATFPAEVNIVYDENYWMNEWDTQWRNDKTLLNNAYLYDIYEFNRNNIGYLGEDYTIVGFPCAPQKGALISADINFAISAKSGCKDGVWAFLRQYLMDDYQKNLPWQLPISEEVLLEKAKEAAKPRTITDENGNEEVIEDIFYVGGQEIKIEPMTEAEVDVIVNYIKSIENTQSNVTEINNIISEEAAPFFEGQKSVDEVARIIQSRVQLYVDENR